MKFAIVGAGGVGGYFGGKLAAAGLDVTFVARGAHLDALRARGLEVTGPGEAFTVPVRATADAAGAGTADAVLVAVKTWQLDEAIPSICALTGPETAVLPLLNGVGAPADLSRALGADRVLGGLCAVIAWVERPGVIAHLGARASITLGELSGERTARVEAIRDAMERAGIKAIVPADITAAMWKKLAFIASFGGVGAVARAPAGVIRTVGPTRDLLVRAVAEVIAVGRARGVALRGDEVERAMTVVDALPPDGSASMARELAAGKRTELDAWSGAVARMGRESGVPTPVHDAVYAALLPTELRARGEVRF